ncbi:gamma-glutamylcyclotransferase [Sulfurospirillum diekertiae]|uniref:Putative gamma-glutamylcyclotransferase n=1 Tax=Sulfurospirillum diekertiae TaxID=1854492 RepID=A0A290HZY3_9BACT|nr:gamma-glutamylcyclotransferase family protein [Sulfurospirillum diekertiae]ATB70919.1 GGCT_like superfamily protein [Sulfurospirillum diekertiae]QIR75984.1 gamma-glutamylcyclotransferase [Sulfurospirillum diekertiae]QIR78627.1 gamma-glutamylcyclotransferase [Sulfurospirillum diekertiae]
MAHLFTYGSLMFEDVWNRLIKGNYLSQQASLAGYARRSVKGDEYPVIFKANELVEGVVYYDINEEDMAILDAFEGEYYQRTEVELLVKNEPIQACVYVLKEKHFDIIDPKPWSEALFATEGIKRFLAHYKGFA